MSISKRLSAFSHCPEGSVTILASTLSRIGFACKDTQAKTVILTLIAVSIPLKAC